MNRRRCDRCKRPLHGKRSHGFVTTDGKHIHCGSCKDTPRVHVPRVGDRQPDRVGS